jgi:hypothetical protein
MPLVSAQETPFGQKVSTDISPVFRDGDASLLDYLQTNIRLEPARNYIRDQYQRASVRLLIDEQGYVVSLSAIECTDALMSFPFEQLFRQMPLWSPAKKDGKEIRSYVYLDFTYLITANEFSIIHLNSRFNQAHKEKSMFTKVLTMAAIIGALLFIQTLF